METRKKTLKRLKITNCYMFLIKEILKDYLNLKKNNLKYRVVKLKKSIYNRIRPLIRAKKKIINWYLRVQKGCLGLYNLTKHIFISMHTLYVKVKSLYIR